MNSEYELTVTASFWNKKTEGVITLPIHIHEKPIWTAFNLLEKQQYEEDLQQLSRCESPKDLFSSRSLQSLLKSPTSQQLNGKKSEV